MSTPAVRSLLLSMGVALLLCACGTMKIEPTPAGYAKAGMHAVGREDYAAAERYFRSAIAAGGDGEAAAISRDALTELYGARLYPDSLEACTPPAQKSYHAAEERFGTGDYAAATELYRLAAENCPQSATIRVSWADTHYRQGDFEKASTMFREAIAIDPWNRAAWRYLADAEAQLGRRYAAWEASLFAVLSDPTYEMAWVYLGRFSQGAVRRIRADKPRVTGDDGKPTIYFDPDQADGDRWMGYALKGLGTTSGSPLANERARVEYVLKAYPIQPASAARPGFWDQMQAAKDAGYLDEAIFLNLIDRDLAPEYAKYRDEHRGRLVEYMKKFVTTPPVSPRAGSA